MTIASPLPRPAGCQTENQARPGQSAVLFRVRSLRLRGPRRPSPSIEANQVLLISWNAFTASKSLAARSGSVIKVGMPAARFDRRAGVDESDSRDG